MNTNKLFLLGVLMVASILTRVSAEEYTEWRSTQIVSAGTNLVIATGAIYLYDITVTSAADGSTFRFFNSTAAPIVTSTSTLYDTGTKGITYPIGKKLSKGFMYTTTGLSQLDIRWDWILSIPSGQETRGLP